jgi:signal transduction histidine kinase/CheY-like chemotaxis protein
MLDIRTLTVLGAITMAVSAAAFFSLYRFRFADKSPLVWGVSSTAITLGCVLLACRDAIGPVSSIIAANLLIVFGYGLIWAGMRLFLERKAPIGRIALFLLVLAPLLYWFTFHDPSITVRTCLVRLALAILAALTWRELARDDPGRYGRPQRVVAGLYALETVVNAAFALAPFFTEPANDFLNAGLVTALFLLVCNVYMIIHILGIVVLYGEYFRRDLVAARDGAEAASTAKSRFLAHMSHELRTPLNGLLGMLELLRAAASETERRDYLEAADSSAHSLLAIINDILTLSRLEAHKYTLAPGLFPLAATLEEILGPFSYLAAQQGLAFSLTVTPPEAWIETDAARIRQIVLNLTGNALKFTRQGRIDVTAAVAAEAPGEDRLRLCVADTGCGISPDNHTFIFDNFSQTEDGARQGGAGLGLAISRQLARLLGGDIHVASVAGAGSRFTLDIPCRSVPPGDVPQAATPTARPTVADLASIPPLRLLLVDDFAPNRTMLAAMLRKAGHAVTEAADGEAAVASVAAAPFDLVLMDNRMPGMDGQEATGRIRELPGGGPPVVGLTASALPGDRQRCLAAGMDDYLVKPVSLAALRNVLLRFARPQDKRGDAPAAWPGALGGTVLPPAPRRPAAEPPGRRQIDWERALAFMGGHREDLVELCGVVEQTFGQTLAALAASGPQDFPDGLRDVGHRLRPSLEAFGALALGGLAEDVDRAADCGDRAGLKTATGKLRQGLEAFLVELRAGVKTLE